MNKSAKSKLTQRRNFQRQIIKRKNELREQFRNSHFDDPLEFNTDYLDVTIDEHIEIPDIKEEEEEIQEENKDTKLSKIELILNNLTKLDEDLKMVKRDQSKILEILGANIKSTDMNFYLNLPISSDDGLVELNENCADEIFAEQFSQFVKPYGPNLSSKGSDYGLSRIISHDVILNYNWDGGQGKKPFKKLVTLNNVLFKAWENELKTFNDYQNNLRNQFRTLKQRVHQQNYRNRKSKNSF